MYGGQIVETGRTKEVCSDPWHPYTRLLLEAVPEPDPVRAKKIKSGPVKETAGTDQSDAAGGCCPFAGRCGYALECCRRERPEQYVLETGACPASFIQTSTADAAAVHTG